MATHPPPSLPLPALLTGKGQTLRTVGTPDVTAKILQVAAAGSRTRSSLGSSGRRLTSRDVLAWAMANTVAATQKGVSQWAHQGLL